MTVFFDQFTAEQIRAQYIRNIEQMQSMLAKAETTGRKVNGYTAEQLRERIQSFQIKAGA